MTCYSQCWELFGTSVFGDSDILVGIFAGLTLLVGYED